MVVAKTDKAHNGLAAQFADHGRSGPLERAYLALVWGAPAVREGTVDAPLGRSTRNREKIEVKRQGGRQAITHYRVVKRFGSRDRPIAVADRMPAGDRPHPPDPRPHGRDRPPAGRRSGLWLGLPHQGRQPAGARPYPSFSAFRARHCTPSCSASSTPSRGDDVAFESPLPDDFSALIDAFKTL